MSQSWTGGGGGCGRDGWEAWLSSRPTTHQLKNPNCLHPPPTPILPQGGDQLDPTKRTQDKSGKLFPEVTRARKQMGEQDPEKRPVVRACRGTSPHPDWGDNAHATQPETREHLSWSAKVQVGGLHSHLGCSWPHANFLGEFLRMGRNSVSDFPQVQRDV